MSSPQMSSPQKNLVNAAALLLLALLLLLPNRLGDLQPLVFLALPLELVVIGALLLLPGRSGWWMRWVVALVCVLGLLLKLADMASFQVFARPVNPLYDGYLIINGLQLLDGTLGNTKALLLLGGVLLGLALIACGAFWVLGSVQQLVQAHRRTTGVVLGALLVVWLILAQLYPVSAAQRFYQHLAQHAQAGWLSYRDVSAFRQLLAEQESVAPDAELLARLQGKNVLVIFVESYGATLLEKPEFAAHIRPLLTHLEGELSAQDYAMRSGWLSSPTLGGLSWLAHATAMSGLWIDNEIRYKSLMMSQRPTLNRLFQQAGWRTLAVMPAITMAWPEGEYYGYSEIYHAHNLGYAGLPFNWVTMPDQYTLAAFHARAFGASAATGERAAQPERPVMAEIALISSHAPWTPVPQLVDWRAVGDGRIFNEQALAGDSPETVWKDLERIRLQYRLAAEYALQTIVSYVQHYGDDDMVLLVLGDHQPAPLVTQDTAKPADYRVPVHFIARDPQLLQAIEHWHWAAGLLPTATTPVWRMDALRDRWLEAFSLPAKTDTAD